MLYICIDFWPKSPSNCNLKKLLNQTDADGPDSQDGRALMVRVSKLGNFWASKKLCF